MLQNWRAWVLACLLVTVSGVAHAFGQLGDPAPPLSVSEWVKNGPVDIAAGLNTKVYLIEFWGSLCGYCRTATPLLSAFQQQYASQGLVVVGIDVYDSSAAASAYVGSMGNRMDYAVAIDDAMSNTTANYMYAFGLYGIPCALLIDKQGRIAWANYVLVGGSLNPEMVQKVKDLLAVSVRGPGGAFVEEGQSHVFTVAYSGLTDPVTFQWCKNQEPIAGATASSYTIDSAEPGDAGWYDCVVTAAGPSFAPINTSPAELQVYPVGSLPVAGLPGLMALAALVGVSGSAIARRRPA